MTMNNKLSIYTRVGKFIKSISGINDLSLVRKSFHKQIGKLFYHKKYNSEDLVRIMQDMGMRRGSVVCIHSSMKEFYNYTGTASDLIEKILECIGEDGTLMMPAFPDKHLVKRADYVFDPLSDKTGAGYLAETFRLFPGVKRSINVQHSVCAIGKFASYLTKDHQFSKDCWDEFSPWQRSLELGVLVFNLGLPRSFMGTFHHCIESKLKEEHPYWAQFFTSKEVYKYYDSNRDVCEYTNMVSRLDRRTRKKQVTRFFDSDDWQIRKLSNLEIKVYYTAHCFPKMLKLGREGITVYYIPSPKEYSWGAGQ